jgi:hypothetical protein
MLGMQDHTTDHEHGDGLHEDLVRLASRRDALRIFGAGGAASILSALRALRALAATPTAEVPTETAGPYRATARTVRTCPTISVALRPFRPVLDVLRGGR